MLHLNQISKLSQDHFDYKVHTTNTLQSGPKYQKRAEVRLFQERPLCFRERFRYDSIYILRAKYYDVHRGRDLNGGELCTRRGVESSPCAVMLRRLLYNLFHGFKLGVNCRENLSVSYPCYRGIIV